jgi:Leucine-rich repeat (LRR) protein
LDLSNQGSSAYPNLQVLDLSGQKEGLVGNIPESLANLPFLSTLNLGGNHLSGSIPPVLGNMGQLRVLNLSNNKLSQSIPKELGKLGEFVLISYVHFVYSVMMLCLTHMPYGHTS